MKRRRGGLIVLILLAGCSGGSDDVSSVKALPMTFVYDAATAVVPDVDFDTCTDKQVVDVFEGTGLAFRHEDTGAITQ